MLITLEKAKETELGKKILSIYFDLHSPKHCLLSSFILLELNNPQSKWKYYLDILPKSYENFPIFFNDEEKSWFIGSPFLKQINEKISDIEEDYNLIKYVLSNIILYIYP